MYSLQFYKYNQFYERPFIYEVNAGFPVLKGRGTVHLNQIKFYLYL